MAMGGVRLGAVQLRVGRRAVCAGWCRAKAAGGDLCMRRPEDASGRRRAGPDAFQGWVTESEGGGARAEAGA
jgi:hypothetical protein